MPIPQPQTGETHDDFISRCMGDNIMVSDYPDNAQRYAVCMDQVKMDNIRRAVQEFNDKDKAKK